MLIGFVTSFVILPFQVVKVSQQSYQELILTEDEKRLLAKEGMNLPNQFPLTKVYLQLAIAL